MLWPSPARHLTFVPAVGALAMMAVTTGGGVLALVAWGGFAGDPDPRTAAAGDDRDPPDPTRPRPVPAPQPAATTREASARRCA